MLLGGKNVAVRDLLRKENLWELAAYAVKNGYVLVPTKAKEEVLRMFNPKLPVLIVRTNRKVEGYYSIEEMTADFVKRWAEERGTPYVQKKSDQISLFDALESE
jgi:hypothetical protein